MSLYFLIGSVFFSETLEYIQKDVEGPAGEEMFACVVRHDDNSIFHFFSSIDRKCDGEKMDNHHLSTCRS